MPRYGRPGGRRPPGGHRGVRGYTLRGKKGRINYVGVTNTQAGGLRNTVKTESEAA